MTVGDGFKFGFGFTIGVAVASLVAWIPVMLVTVVALGVLGGR